MNKREILKKHTWIKQLSYVAKYPRDNKGYYFIGKINNVKTSHIVKQLNTTTRFKDTKEFLSWVDKNSKKIRKVIEEKNDTKKI